MRDISRRLNNIEKKLNFDKEQIIVRINDTYGDKDGFDLSNPSEEWLTYPEAAKNAYSQGGVIVLNTSKEIAARKEQLNVSKRRNNE